MYVGVIRLSLVLVYYSTHMYVHVHSHINRLTAHAGSLSLCLLRYAINTFWRCWLFSEKASYGNEKNHSIKSVLTRNAGWSKRLLPFVWALWVKEFPCLIDSAWPVPEHPPAPRSHALMWEMSHPSAIWLQSLQGGPTRAAANSAQCCGC